MSSVKSPTNLPAEKVPGTKKVVMPMSNTQEPAPNDPSKGSIVRFKVVSINDSPFYGSLAEAEIIYIWEKTSGQCRGKIFAMS